MNNFKLSNRLKQCASRVSHGSKIADIGTDHAYIPIYLALKSKISSALACDINIGPLKNAQNNIQKYKLEKTISIRLSDGLKNINSSEANEIIIAGMGGNMIANILSNCNWNNKDEKKFILNPMKYDERLRKFLYENGYEITFESAVSCCGKIYTVMDVIYTSRPHKYNPHELYTGKLEKKITPENILYIEKQLKNINNHLLGAKSEKRKDKESYFKKVYDEINTIMNIMQKGDKQ